jgi:hypothetical protein
MFRWLSVPVTPVGFDAALDLVGGGACAVFAVINAILGYWWPALMFAVLATGPLWMTWQYACGRDSKPDRGGMK